MWALSGWMGHQAQALLRHGLDFGREAAFNERAILSSMFTLTTDAFVLAGPIFALTIVAAIAAPIMIGGWLFSAKAVRALSDVHAF